MTSTIFTLIIAFLCLIALMVIHEFGHFIIAKKFGVAVDEFGIGYLPKIFGNLRKARLHTELHTKSSNLTRVLERVK